MLKLGMIVPILGLAGCAVLPGVQNEELATFTRDDLNAAISIAQAGGDDVAANCYTQIRDHYTVVQGPAIEIKGLFSAHAAARQARRAAQAGVPEPVHLACSPLVVDAQSFVIRRILD